MATVCPYCNTEVSEALIEAEDGCCPECGAVIGATSSFLAEQENGGDYEYDDDQNDVLSEFDDDDDNDFSRSEYEDDIFDDDLDGDLDSEFDDDVFGGEEDDFDFDEEEEKEAEEPPAKPARKKRR